MFLFIAFHFVYKFGMRDCMKLLISSFLDNILYKCMLHVFSKHS